LRSVVGSNASSDTSFAFFGPAWTYEKLGAGTKQGFIRAETAVWARRSLAIIDSGGVVSKGRETVTDSSALNGWTVTYSPINSLSSCEWLPALHPDEYWSISGDLVATTGYQLTRKTAVANLSSLGISNIGSVSGSVDVKGTAPNFSDKWAVELRVKTASGESYSVSRQGQGTEEWLNINFKHHPAEHS
jgi:hypothetical protein